VLKPLISDRGTLQPQALSARGVKVIQTRCMWAGALGLVIVPVTLPLALLWVGLRQAEDALAARATTLGPVPGPRLATPALRGVRRASARCTSPSRPLKRARPAFHRRVPLPAASAVGRGVASVAAALLALLAAVGATDEDALILVTLGGRSLRFYAALLGAACGGSSSDAACHSRISRGSPCCTLAGCGTVLGPCCPCALAAALRFTPHAWCRQLFLAARCAF